MAKQFVELEAEQILSAIEGHEDCLTPAFEHEQARITAIICPRCGENAVMKVDPERPFVPDRPIPVYVPFCPKCDAFITSG